MNQSKLPISVISRLSLALIGQKKKNTICPTDSPFQGRVALVTGATGGIGKETVKGLLERGISTIITGRSESKVKETVLEMENFGFDKKMIYSCVFDLADLDSLKNIAELLRKQLGDLKIGILIENAGVWPKNYSETKQNYEIAFGTNVLGHFALRKILQKDLLEKTARIVVLTGDIYITEREANTDLTYRGLKGGMKAYCQSKLGNIWVAKELQRRNPDFTVAIVHPGVINSNLGGSGSIGHFFNSFFMLSTREGAQTSLYCATQNEIVKGGYYHNAIGLTEFAAEDPALFQKEAERLWDFLEDRTKFT